MRKTLWDARARAALLERIAKLSADAAPRWGRMSAGEMLAHVVMGMRMATGEVATRPRKGPFRHWPLKYLFVYWLPFPRSAPAPREVVTRGHEVDWNHDLAQLRTMLEDFARTAPKSWPLHPIFGKLSPRAWGALGWRHLDHHLRQFGV